MKKLLATAIIGAAVLLSATATAATINVVAVIDPALENQREQIDTAIAEGLALSNHVVGEVAGVDAERVLIDSVVAETPVIAAALQNGPAAARAAKAFLPHLAPSDDPEVFSWVVNGGTVTGELATIVEQADNVIFIVASMGGGHIGNASGETAIVVSWMGDERDPITIAHEFGHVDGLEHAEAEAHFAETGDQILMYPTGISALPASGVIITDAEVADIQDSASRADEGYLLMWNHSPLRDEVNLPSQAEELPVPSIIATLNPATLSVDEGANATYTIELDAPAAADVSVEVFTKGITATAGDDYPQSNIKRVVIPAGETQATFTIATTADAIAEGAETLTVGLRHGRGVSVTSTTNTLTIKASTGGGTDTGGGDNGGGGGGGSMGGFGIGLLALLVALRRKMA